MNNKILSPLSKTLPTYFVSDEAWKNHLEAEWKKKLRLNLDRCYGLVFSWKDGLSTVKISRDLRLSCCRTLELLHILKEEDMIYHPDGNEEWWKATPWEAK